MGIMFLLGARLSFRYFFGCPEYRNQEHVARYIEDGEGIQVKEGYIHAPEANFRERAYLVLLEVNIPITLMISVLLWTALFPVAVSNGAQDSFLDVHSIFYHAINVPILLVEFFLNGVYFQPGHSIYVAIYGALYLLITSGRMLRQDLVDEPHCPPYFFVDISTLFYVAYSFGLLVVSIVFYYIGFGLSRLQQSILEG